MMNVIYQRADGGVSIVYPAPKAQLEKVLGPLTQEEYEAHVFTRSVPADAVVAGFVHEDNIPKDRSFRDAWVYNDGIDIDMDKAKEIHMAKIRRARDKKMKELDIETLKGNNVQAQKQVLRDLPQNFKLDRARNPDELKNLWPEEIKEHKP